MRRHAIGIIALVLLVVAGALRLWPIEGGGLLGLEAACWRVGVLMVVLWIAYTDVQRIPAWMLGVVPVLMVLVALRPRLFVYVLPVVLCIAILRPRKKQTPAASGRGKRD